MNEQKYLHGWYSQNAVDALGGSMTKHGYCIYEGVDGKPVMVTEVTTTFDGAKSKAWGDLVYVGPITNRCLQTDPEIFEPDYEDWNEDDIEPYDGEWSDEDY